MGFSTPFFVRYAVLPESEEGILSIAQYCGFSLMKAMVAIPCRRRTLLAQNVAEARVVINLASKKRHGPDGRKNHEQGCYCGNPKLTIHRSRKKAGILISSWGNRPVASVFVFKHRRLSWL